ncbi:MAG: hypothetical protein F6K42_32470, partial [Leptolyngbya sp. SIO1D8]|nr:hypothetical protein [Leptolyngbya sp. SIO1D8]
MLHQNRLVPEGIFQPQEPYSVQPQSEQPCRQGESTTSDCDFVLAHALSGHPTASVIALSQDGKTLVSGGSDKAIKVWDVQTGALKRTLQSDSGVITALTIAPDGKTVVSGAGDRM